MHYANAKVQKKCFAPKYLAVFFTDMTDVDDVFTRWLFYMPLIVVRSSFAFFAISSIPERRTSEGTMTALW